MPAFSDDNGDQWQVKVTIGAVDRCRDIAGIDLLTVVGGDGFGEFIADPVRAAKAVYAVVRPEAIRRGLSEEQFLERLSGDAMDAARNALLDGIVDFFPSPAERRARRNLLAEIRRVIAKEMETLEAETSPERIQTLLASASEHTNSPG
jgi:hypothetical protein